MQFIEKVVYFSYKKVVLFTFIGVYLYFFKMFMRQVFARTIVFTGLFILILCIDIYVKLALDQFPYRYVSKPLVMLLLMGFYLTNHHEVDKKKFFYVLFALSSFLIGDIFLITHLNTFSLISGMSFFMIGKVLYSFKFSHVSDFKVNRLIPFLLVIFAFMAALFSLIYDNLGDYFIPVLFYFFVSLLTLQIAYLRKNAVNFKSYMLVLIGLEIFVVGESVMAIKMFYQDIPYQDIMTMVFYGLSQYLIILGLIKEETKVIPVNKT